MSDLKEPGMREKLLIALVEGEEISAVEFAQRLGICASTVTNRLRGLQGLLHRRDASSGPGKRRTLYRAADVEKLKAKLDEEVFARCHPSRPRLSFDDLLQAWGIALKPPRKARIPGHVHRMETEEDQQIEEAA